ncbi:MAG: hypothetical protein AB7F35_27065 [Acetobacteraceae bacterium]
MGVNPEVVIQALDAVAFMLVTPQILGDKSVEPIRRLLVAAAKKLGIPFDPLAPIETKGKVAILLASLALLAGTIWIGGAADEFVKHHVARINALPRLATIAAVTMCLGAFIWSLMASGLVALSAFAALAVSLLARTTMFVFGAAIFFAARSLAVWHYWNI